ncbi:MAG: glycosyltransferase [Deltaproteobacteria bacterium]|nr:glycosyltransferase [Deltaproteobacteria bacterium]
MRIALVTNGLLYGGVERLVEALAVDLVTGGDEVQVVAITRDGPIGSALRARGIPVTVLHIRGSRDVRVPLQLAAILWRFRADVVHSHLAIADLAAMLARPFAPGAAAVTTVHSFYGPPQVEGLKLTVWRAGLRTFDHVVFVGDSVRTSLPAMSHATIVRPSLFDPARTVDRVRARAALGIADETPLVMAVGRLVPVKGFDMLGRAAPMLTTPGARILLVGEGPSRQELSRYRQLELVGGRDDAAALIAAADVLVCPSRSEGFPQVPIEAMAAGVPVVATNVGGVPEVVVPGRGGCLVPVEDPAALAAALDALLVDRDQARALGEAGRSRLLEEDLTRQSMVRQTREIYEAVTRRRRRQ